MKKIFVGLLIFVQLFFCIGCGTMTYTNFDYDSLDIKAVEIGYTEGAFNIYTEYADYECFKKLNSQEMEELIKQIKNIQIFHAIPKTAGPYGNCVKIILADESFWIMSVGGVADYDSNGKRREEWAYGQVGEAWEFLDILSKYVELKEDEYWSQEVLDLYRSSLQEN